MVPSDIYIYEWAAWDFEGGHLRSKKMEVLFKKPRADEDAGRGSGVMKNGNYVIETKRAILYG